MQPASISLFRISFFPTANRSRSANFLPPFPNQVKVSIFGGPQLENRRVELHQSFQMCLGADKGQIEHELDPQECFDEPSNRLRDPEFPPLRPHGTISGFLLEKKKGNFDLKGHQNTPEDRARALSGLYQPLNASGNSGEVPRDGFRAGARRRSKIPP